MGKYYLKLPKMGESIAEATLTSWLKNVGDKVDIDEPIVEIATDKVDSDVPSEYKGVLVKRNFEVDQIIKVGEVIAEIETDDIIDVELKDNSHITLESNLYDGVLRVLAKATGLLDPQEELDKPSVVGIVMKGPEEPVIVNAEEVNEESLNTPGEGDNPGVDVKKSN